MDDVQALCARGQERLEATDYLAAERLLTRAEAIAWAARDWDALYRLYMPLQEARRQRRQRCGEGVVKLDCVARNACETIVPEAICAAFGHGQLLVAGWGDLGPSASVRRIAAERGLYVETYLAATYPAGAAGQFVVAIVPTENVAMPPADGRPIDALAAALPPFSLIVADSDLPAGERPGSDATFAETMARWEALHRPFLAHAEACVDPFQKMAAFRRTIEVDYACELAHQHLATTARAQSQAARGQGD